MACVACGNSSRISSHSTLFRFGAVATCLAIKLAYVMVAEHVSEAPPAPVSLVVISRLQGVPLSHP